MKEDFKKRCIKKRSNHNDETQPEFKIMAIIIIAMIYAITLIIMKTAQGQGIAHRTTTTRNEFKTDPMNIKNPEKDINVEWTVRKRDRNLQDWKTNRKSRLAHDNNKENVKAYEQPLEASITTCLSILVKYSKYSLQEKIDHIEDMENSRKICLAALYESKDQIQQQSSREIIYMLIAQLENKHLEEQLLKLKLETEKEAGWLIEHMEEESTFFTSANPSSL